VVAQPIDIGIRTIFFEPLAIAAAAFTLAVSLPPHQRPSNSSNRLLERLLESGRYLFAVSSIVFGIDHFLILRFIASLIPRWFPGGFFWANFTGARPLSQPDSASLSDGWTAGPQLCWERCF
jgi:hypothetical protein